VTTRVRDGANLRHERILAMLGFVELGGGHSADTLDIQAYMLERYGLKFQTTADYLRECHLAGFIRATQDGWIVTDRWRKFRSV